MDDDVFGRLQRWYIDQCDGDWEHGEGINIATLDNPGWRVKISLDGTQLGERAFERLQIDRTDDDWLHAWVEAGQWHAACGPLNLVEAIGAFLAWSA